MKKLFLIDAYALIYRFHYAFISNPMRNPVGVNVSAVYGFVKFLYELIDRESPEYLGVAFDPRGGNFRHKLFEQYKANRDATPEDIITATPIIKSILEALRIPILEVAGYEADDVIGTLSHRACESGEFSTYMVTPDKDYGQLVTDCSRMYKPSKSMAGYEVWGVEEVCANFGIESPRQVIDILAIMGDSADNIPGVMGIGEVGARKLIAEYGSVEGVVENIENLRGAVKTKIESSLEMMRLSKELATICTDVPIDFSPDELRVCEPDVASLRGLYVEHNFRVFLQRLDSENFHAAAIADNGGEGTVSRRSYSQLKVEVVQGSLFGDPVVVSTPAVRRVAATPPPAIVGEGVTSFRNIENREHTYMTIDTAEELEVLIDGLKSVKALAFDTETTSLEPITTKLLGVSLCADSGSAYWIPTTTEGWQGMLQMVLCDPSIDKIGQNIKFDIEVLKANGIEVQGRLYDTMIMHYLVDPEGRHSLDIMARNFLGYDMVPIEQLVGKGSRQLSMAQVPPQQLAEYACEDADITFELYNIFRPMVEERSAMELYHRVEEPLIRVLAEMELLGVKIDPEILSSIGEKLTAKITEIEEDIYTLAESRLININSPKQLGELLFEKLKLNEKAKKTKTGQYKTDEATLEALSGKHPIVAKILEYRGLKKLLSTYIDALPQLINPKSGRVHTSFNQALTATGRLSSSNPNLQNIPIREEVGREIRGAFVSGSDDCVIMAADYSQVELRIMAHMSGDKNLIAAFLADEDVHTATAAKIYGVPLNEVTAEQRRRAKMANFGIIYGISKYGLASRLEIPNSEAGELIDGYFALYPGVKSYMERTVVDARELGYVETIFGRRRYLSDINSNNGMTRGLAERNAINAPIQGSAADIMKLAMIGVNNALKASNLKARMVLQIHDEIVLEVPKSEIDAIHTILQQEMSSAATLQVPLTIEIGTANSWKDAH